MFCELYNDAQRIDHSGTILCIDEISEKWSELIKLSRAL